MTETSEAVTHRSYYAGRRLNRASNGKVAAKPLYTYVNDAGDSMNFNTRLPGDFAGIGTAVLIEETTPGSYRYAGADLTKPNADETDAWVALDMACMTRLAEDRMIRKAQPSEVERAIETLATAAAKLGYADRAAFVSAISAKVSRG